MNTSLPILLVLFSNLSFAIESENSKNDSEIINCIDKEKIELNGVFQKNLPTGFFNRNIREKNGQESCKQLTMPRLHAIKGTLGDMPGADRKLGDSLEYDDYKCSFEIEEIPNTRTQYGTADFRYRYHSSVIVKHSPGSDVLEVQRKINLPGKKATAGLKLESRNIYLKKEDSLPEIKNECEQAGGTLSGDVSYKEDKQLTLINSEGIPTGSNSWSSSALCTGDFYIYEQDLFRSAEKECEAQEKLSAEKGVMKVVCSYRGNFSKMLPRVSKGPQQSVTVSAFLTQSFKKEDNEKNFKQWQCDRFASCQAKARKITDKEVIASFMEACKLSKDDIFKHPKTDESNAISNTKFKINIPDNDADKDSMPTSVSK